MGISGHMLGEKKLRRLRRITGLEHIDRAYTRGRYTEARLLAESSHLHIQVDMATGEWAVADDPIIHWSSCPQADDSNLSHLVQFNNTEHLEREENR